MKAIWISPGNDQIVWCSLCTVKGTVVILKNKRIKYG